MRILVSLPAGLAKYDRVQSLLCRAADVACATAHTTLIDSLTRARAQRGDDASLFFCTSDAVTRRMHESDMTAADATRNGHTRQRRAAYATSTPPTVAADAVCASDNCLLGSGAGTVHLLQQCFIDEQRAAADASRHTHDVQQTRTAATMQQQQQQQQQQQGFAAWLTRERRVLVHAGGHSRRLPGYSSMSKLLVPMPQAALPPHLLLSSMPPRDDEQQQQKECRRQEDGKLHNTATSTTTTTTVQRMDEGSRGECTVSRHMDQVLLSLQLPLLTTIADAAPAHLCTLVACGDVYLQPRAGTCEASVRTLLHSMSTIATSSGSGSGSGSGSVAETDGEVDVVCIGVRSTPARLQRHGVLCVYRHAPHVLAYMLQKPSLAALQQQQQQQRGEEGHAGACACDMLLDTGIWLLSARAVAELRRRCRRSTASPSRQRHDGAAEECDVLPALRPYDLYRDFAYALRTPPHRSQCSRADDRGDGEDDDVTTTTTPPPSLRVRVVELDGFDFHHMGTSAELFTTAAAVAASMNACTSSRATVLDGNVASARSACVTACNKCSTSSTTTTTTTAGVVEASSDNVAASAAATASAPLSGAVVVIHDSVVDATLPLTQPRMLWIDSSWVSAHWQLHTHHILTGLPPPPPSPHRQRQHTPHAHTGDSDKDSGVCSGEALCVTSRLQLLPGVCVAVERVRRDVVVMAQQHAHATATSAQGGSSAEGSAMTAAHTRPPPCRDGAMDVLLVARPYSLDDTYAPPCTHNNDDDGNSSDKRSHEEVSVRFVGQPLQQWLTERGLCIADVAPLRRRPGRRRGKDNKDDDDDESEEAEATATTLRTLDVQHARLFPCCDDVATLYRVLRWMLPSSSTTTTCDAQTSRSCHSTQQQAQCCAEASLWRRLPRLSAADLANMTDAQAMCAHRAHMRRAMLTRLLTPPQQTVSSHAQHDEHRNEASGTAAAAAAATARRDALFQCVDLGVLASTVAELQLPLPPPPPPLPPPPPQGASHDVYTNLVAALLARMHYDMLAAQTMRCLAVAADDGAALAARQGATAATTRDAMHDSGNSAHSCSCAGERHDASAVVRTQMRASTSSSSLLQSARAHEQHARALLQYSVQLPLLLLQPPHATDAAADVVSGTRATTSDTMHDCVVSSAAAPVTTAAAAAAADAAATRRLPPYLAVRAGQTVRCRSPLRIDLCGGWTDTPPYSDMCGGCVVNAAVTLNGRQMPLCVTVCARPPSQRRLHLLLHQHTQQQQQQQQQQQEQRQRQQQEVPSPPSSSPVIILRACRGTAATACTAAMAADDDDEGGGDSGDEDEVVAELVLRSYDDLQLPGTKMGDDEPGTREGCDARGSARGVRELLADALVDATMTTSATTATLHETFTIARAALQLIGFTASSTGVPPASTDSSLWSLSPRRGGAAACVRFGSLQQQLQQSFAGHDLVLTQHVSGVPAGAGLGGSSLLAATMLQALAVFCGVTWTRDVIAQQVLVLEQMIGTGGGWQDVYGGLYGGVKCVQVAARAPPMTGVRLTPLPATLFVCDELAACHLLYFVGTTRAARRSIAPVTRNMLLRNAAVMQTLHEMQHELVPAMCDALTRADWAAYGAVLRASWRRNCRLHSQTTSAVVETVLQRVAPYLVGAKLVGAGGGGFLYMAAKDKHSASHIRHVLKHPPAAGVPAYMADVQLCAHRDGDGGGGSIVDVM